MRRSLTMEAGDVPRSDAGRLPANRAADQDHFGSRVDSIRMRIDAVQQGGRADWASGVFAEEGSPVRCRSSLLAVLRSCKAGAQ